MGYRYYNCVDKAVEFPFGHGLSYSQFKYLDCDLHGHPQTEVPSVNVTLENNSERDGAEIVQVYVRCEQSRVHRPRQQLAGFAKVYSFRP